jgi:gamma-glutamyltranspeptidase/glutathione hydrolase
MSPAARTVASARRYLALFVAVGFLVCAPATRVDADASPALAANGMVVAESEAGAKAGVEMLKQGGNAIDAAAAAALATCVTNAASCGIGGGGFMLIFDAKSKKLYALDYRERAPAKASAPMFLKHGKPDTALSQSGALAVAVPGEIAGIDAALNRFGTMKFQRVAAPAIRLAHDGFTVSPLLAHEIAAQAAKLANDEGLRGSFLKPDGSTPKRGDTIYQKNLATTLQRLGDTPTREFYRGPIAREIALRVQKAGGILTADDLASYEVVWREPLHRRYQGFDMYAMPPPSSGGVVLEMLGILEPGHLGGLGVNSPPYLARIIEVMRQGFLDRALYGDPAFVNVPIRRLLSDEHIAEARERALGAKPAAAAAEARGAGTSNLCVADREGNVVVLTTTINTVFGAKLSVPSLGIILNNEMDDFSIGTGVPNAYQLAGADANAIAPGKRPLSSMAPVIALKDGKPVLALGGSGGPTIITGVLQVALNVIDSHLDVARAVGEPRAHQQAVPDVVVVEEAIGEPARAALGQMGYKLRVVPRLGAISAIGVSAKGISGANDPRKGGAAIGF